MTDPNQYDDSPSDSPSASRHRSPYLRALAWAAGILVICVGLAFGFVMALVNTNRGHQYLLGFVERKASDALGVQVQVANLTPHLGTLSADLYGIRISGAAPHSKPPLLQVDHLEVGVRVVSLWHRTWYLNSVRVDHPVAWIVVDKNGASNLPVFKSSGSSHTDIFQMGIRHVQIARGQVYYNSRPEAIAADLHDLAFKSTFNSLLTRYSGTLAYAQGSLTFGAYRPLPHNLQVDFAATPQTFTLSRGSISAGPSNVTISATLQNYNDPIVQAKYDVVLDGRQAAELLNESTMPAGKVHLSGSLQYRNAASRSFLESLAISGGLTSDGLVVNTPTIHTRVLDLSARYSLANGNAIVQDARAKIFGGIVTVNGRMEALGGNSHSSFDLALHNASLSQAVQAFQRPAPGQTVSLRGSANAQASATWGKTLDDLRARADLTLNGHAVRRQLDRSQTPQEVLTGTGPANYDIAIPIQGALHAIYSNASQELALNNSYLRSAQSNVSLNGTISRRSSLAVGVNINDLSEVATLVDLLATKPGQARTDLTGRASFQGIVRGSVRSPQLSGQLSAENLGYQGTKWKALQTGIELSPAHAGLENLHLEGTGREKLTGNAGVDLQDWKFSKHSLVQLTLNASGLDAATIAALAQQQTPVTGTLSMQAHLHGEAIDPAGTSHITLSKATAYGEPVSQATVNLSGSGENLKATANVQLPAGSIHGQVTVQPAAKTFAAQLDSSGIDLGKLQAVEARVPGAKGTLQIHADGQGSFDNPKVSATLEIPKLAIGSQDISQTRLQVNAANHVANAEIASSVAGASLHGKAQVNLRGDYLTDASFDTQSFSLEPFLAAYEPEEGPGLTGQAEIHATVHGPLKNRSLLQVHVTLPVLRVAYGNIQLAASPVQADLQNGTATLHPLTIRGTDTQLNVQAAFPVGRAAPASLKVQGAVNLQVLQIFDPELQASGQLKVNVDSHAAASRLLAGEIDIADANLSTNSSPVGLQNANGVLKMANGRFEIARFNGTVGGGQVTAQGSVNLRSGARFDLGATLQGARILYPQGVRETVDANLRLTGTEKHAVLGGSVNLADLSFTPAFDLSTLVDQVSSGVEAPSEPGFEQNLQLNIAVNSTNNINLVSQTLSVNGSANLQVTGTAAQPVILGRVDLTGGDVIMHGDRFVLAGGSTVQFINPAMTEPILNVSLTTKIQEWNIDLRFHGPADQMQTQYSADPSLPQADIINLLAFGQTREASAMNNTPMNQQAEGLVASQVANQVTSRISKAAGISQLSISPVLAGGTSAGPPGANLTIRQRVTGNLFVTFSTNVATTQGQIIQGQYNVSPRVTISATRPENGGFAVDALIKKSW